MNVKNYITSVRISRDQKLLLRALPLCSNMLMSNNLFTPSTRKVRLLGREFRLWQKKKGPVAVLYMWLNGHLILNYLQLTNLSAWILHILASLPEVVYPLPKIWIEFDELSYAGSLRHLCWMRPDDTDSHCQRARNVRNLPNDLFTLQANLAWPDFFFVLSRFSEDLASHLWNPAAKCKTRSFDLAVLNSDFSAG